ncbi:MAG: hypothetical protein NTX25_02920, partial [Proteobacteria bacterium]|nr:hypothetical protein [Pseudomonadota bacterium]
MFKDNVITNPRIHLSISLVMVPMIVIFFKPSLQSFLGFFFVDFVSYIIFRRWEIPVFHRIFPRSRLFFPALNSEIFAIKTLEHRLEIYNEMSQFPQRRALFIGLVSS